MGRVYRHNSPWTNNNNNPRLNIYPMTGLHPQGSQNGHQDPDPVEYDRSLDELIDDLMKQQVSRQWASPAILSTLPTSDSLSHTHTHTSPPFSSQQLIPHTHTECCTSQVPLRLCGITTV
jgi:hypothetical protein